VAAVRKAAVTVLTITLGVLAATYDGTAVRIILWSLTALAGAVLLLDAANTEAAQTRVPWLIRLPLVRDRPSELPAPSRAPVTATSLALQLRAEGDRLSDLRGRLRSDRLGRTVMGPPPEYQIELDQAKQRIVSLLKRDHEDLAHEFLGEIPSNWLSGLFGGGHEADRLDRVIKVYSERLNRIVERVKARARPLAERLTEQLRQGDGLMQHFSEQMYPVDATAETVWGPIDNALTWAGRVEAILRVEAPEWLPEFRTAGYEIPSDPQPGDVTVGDMESMLRARVKLLGRIIRELQRRAA
jgi:hypothetical protein